MAWFNAVSKLETILNLNNFILMNTVLVYASVIEWHTLASSLCTSNPLKNPKYGTLSVSYEISLWKDQFPCIWNNEEKNLAKKIKNY